MCNRAPLTVGPNEGSGIIRVIFEDRKVKLSLKNPIWLPFNILDTKIINSDSTLKLDATFIIAINNNCCVTISVF